MCGSALQISERFQAKWKPVRFKKTRQIKNPEPCFDSIEAEKALDGRVQPWVQGKGLLQSHIEISGCSCGDEYQIPAVRGHRAWNRNELVLAQQLVAVALLTGAGDCRPEPVGVGKRCRIDDMHSRGVGNGHRRQDVRNHVESPKALVNCNFEDSGCRIDRAVHRANAFGVPAPTEQKCSFAAGPGRCVYGGVKTPRDQLVAAERRA